MSAMDSTELREITLPHRPSIYGRIIQFTVALALCATLTQCAQFNNSRAAPPTPTYQAIGAQLDTASIPVLLPPTAALKKIGYDQEIDPSNFSAPKPNTYSVYFAYQKNCQGAPLCTLGAMYAAKIQKRMPFNNMIAPRSPQHAHIPHRPKSINLTPTLKATLLTNPYNDGTSYSTLSWTQHQVRYQLTLNHANNPAALIALAKSTVDHADWRKQFKAQFATQQPLFLSPLKTHHPHQKHPRLTHFQTIIKHLFAQPLFHTQLTKHGLNPDPTQKTHHGYNL